MSVAVVVSDSPEGREALVRAVEEARLRGGELIACAVSDAGTITEDDSAATRFAVEQILHSRGVENAAFQLCLEPDGGDPAGAIVDLVGALDCDLLVIGSRRRSAAGKLLLGSIATRVILDSPVPVLVVKAA